MAAGRINTLAFQKRRSSIEWRVSQNKQIINRWLQVKSKAFGRNSEAVAFKEVGEGINERLKAEFAVSGKIREKWLLNYFEKHALNRRRDQAGDESDS
jgi:hypothetical protein